MGNDWSARSYQRSAFVHFFLRWKYQPMAQWKTAARRGASSAQRRRYRSTFSSLPSMPKARPIS